MRLWHGTQINVYADDHGKAQVANLAAEVPDIQFIPDGACRNTNGGGADDNGFCTSVRLFLVDPDRGVALTDVATGRYEWDGGHSHCVAILKSASRLEEVVQVRGKIPAGRTVRVIYEAV